MADSWQSSVVEVPFFFDAFRVEEKENRSQDASTTIFVLFPLQCVRVINSPPLYLSIL